ncbi:MAG: hypothetical protein IJY58_05500 [Alphaproteobacteria bacterium]|nr:hypothetical protein [Alphaproteobacteria bacterium]
MTERKSLKRRKKFFDEEIDLPKKPRVSFETPPFEEMENPKKEAEEFLKKAKPLLIGQPLHRILNGGFLTSCVEDEQRNRLIRFYEEECNALSTQDHRIMNFIPWATFPVIFEIGEHQLEFDFGKAWSFQLHFNTVEYDEVIDISTKKIKELFWGRTPYDVSCLYGRHAIGATVTDIVAHAHEDQIEMFVIHLSNGNLIKVHEDEGYRIVWVDISGSDYYKMRLPRSF